MTSNAGDWDEETAIITASAGCLARRSIRDLDGTDTNGTLICALDFNHKAMHYDASECIWWLEEAGS
jgi:hypothetical protein